LFVGEFKQMNLVSGIPPYCPAWLPIGNTAYEPSTAGQASGNEKAIILRLNVQFLLDLRPKTCNL
jgi:hypothetical protein